MMDPYAPINGISLERYAELSADVSDTQDPNQQAEIVASKGVSRSDWEAAKAGWTARMADMSLMGQVATRYMPLYQAALARKNGPPPQISFEDYVAMSGCVPVMGIDGMLAHYKITMTQWTQIAGHWNTVIPTNPQYMMFGTMVEAEAARLRAGGQAKPVNLAAPRAPMGSQPGMPGSQPGIPAAAPYGVQPPPNAYAQQPYAQQPYAQPNPYGHQPQSFDNQMNQFGNQVGSAFNAFGNALGSFVDGAVGAFAPGTRVLVQWSDGKRYPGTVASMQNGQVQVSFPDGRQVWVPQQYVSIGG